MTTIGVLITTVDTEPANEKTLNELVISKYVKALLTVIVPFALVMTKSFAPAVLAGVVKVNEVDVELVGDMAAPPKVADVIVERLVPVTTVDVPPEIGPEVTESEVTVGSGR